jgi:hypothetical protein
MSVEHTCEQTLLTLTRLWVAAVQLEQINDE